MWLLAVDTATQHTVAGLLHQQRLVGRLERAGRRHSRYLFELVDQLLAGAGIGPAELGALGVGRGPGSFTGVRVGMSWAKTLALSCDIPLVGVSTLEVLAVGQQEAGHTLVVPVVDALKGQVYAARYYLSGSQPPQVISTPAAWNPRQLAAELAASSEPVWMAGSGLLRYREIFAESLGRHLLTPRQESAHVPRGDWLARLAAARLVRQGPDDRHHLEPDYCRLADAELVRSR
ncbi:MAG: tRNA (adenosine(37)-N6)-threonylcarbamoyltransferase complex dimerization subunit type 1 TsaB [Deltaproteobacteria bacterium]|nr:MAG: tRNA (adenosine(37)-N6)-threonylcarbamoyltransferase complex dimerization subunit type 1 TsaB [Deltaproteobacteria bacterium]